MSREKCWMPKQCLNWGCYYHYKEDQCVDTKEALEAHDGA